MGLSEVLERPLVLLDVHDVTTITQDEAERLEQGGLIQRMIGTELMYEPTLGTRGSHIRITLASLRAQ